MLKIEAPAFHGLTPYDLLDPEVKEKLFQSASERDLDIYFKAQSYALSSFPFQIIAVRERTETGRGGFNIESRLPPGYTLTGGGAAISGGITTTGAYPSLYYSVAGADDTGQFVGWNAALTCPVIPTDPVTLHVQAIGICLPR